MRVHHVTTGDVIRLSSTSPVRYRVLSINALGDMRVVMVGPRMVVTGEPFMLHADTKYIKE